MNADVEGVAVTIDDQLRQIAQKDIGGDKTGHRVGLNEVHYVLQDERERATPPEQLQDCIISVPDDRATLRMCCATLGALTVLRCECLTWRAHDQAICNLLVRELAVPSMQIAIPFASGMIMHALEGMVGNTLTT